MNKWVEAYEDRRRFDFHPRLREIRRDGQPVTQLLCPKCERWADIDADQLHGRVSVFHDVPDCGYHETVDWLAERETP